VNVGLSTPVKLSTGKLKVGLFMNAMSNKYQQVLSNAATQQAKAYGWDLTTLDFNFDQQAMLNAMQNAVTNHTYNAWIVNPIDGVASCKMLTQTAPAANIIVVVTSTTVCGHDDDSVGNLWAPGTYSYDSVSTSADYFRVGLDAIGKANPGPQKVAILVGQADSGATIEWKSLAAEYEAKHPDFHVDGYIYTDYTAPTTYTMTQAYLQAHPDTTLVISIYSPDISEGMVRAVDSLNVGSHVKMADMGGAQYSVGEINAGVIQLTMPYYPANMGANAVKSIRQAQEGATPVRVVDDVPGGWQHAPVVTRANVGSFTPQY